MACTAAEVALPRQTNVQWTVCRLEDPLAACTTVIKVCVHAILCRYVLRHLGAVYVSEIKTLQTHTGTAAAGQGRKAQQEHSSVCQAAAPARTAGSALFKQLPYYAATSSSIWSTYMSVRC